MKSDQSLCSSLDHSMTVKLLTEQHLEFLSLIGDCTGLSESTLLKIKPFWKSHAPLMCLHIFIKKHDNLGPELQCILKVKDDLS